MSGIIDCYLIYDDIYRNDFVSTQSDDVTEDEDLHVADIRDEVVVVTLFCLDVHVEVIQVRVRLLRRSHVVLADSLEVNHLGIESPEVRISGSEADGNL